MIVYMGTINAKNVENQLNIINRSSILRLIVWFIYFTIMYNVLYDLLDLLVSCRYNYINII